MRLVRVSIAAYIAVIIFLFLYSFTQVDLNLTLSKWSIWQVIEKFFQHIGYFQRPLSTFFFIAIVVLLYVFYFLFLFFAQKKLISKKQTWFLIILTALILTFSYNAFSYDLFNYIFDAKIFTHYHQNPYLHKALDYPGEPMLSFMRWTHRTYPYGPAWLFLTVPLSFMGFNLFLPTFFIFKALMSASFLGTALFVGKILKKASSRNELLGTIFFAFNPLVIIESLVSSHNDIVMLFFAVSALYLFMNSKYIRVFILLIISIAIKFATILLAPALAVVFIYKKLNRKISWRDIFIPISICMSIAVVVASIRTNFQPWYLLYVLPFASLLPDKYFAFIPSSILSFFALLTYVPFLYVGDWNSPIPEILTWIMISGVVLSLLSVGVFKLRMVE